jgi:hypothetical protein
VTDCLTIVAVPPPPGNGIIYMRGQEYACLNWCHHLHQSLINGDTRMIQMLSEGYLMGLMEGFVSWPFKFWVNTLLHNGYGKVMDALDLVLSILKVSDVFHQSWSFRQFGKLPSSNNQILHRVHCKS